MKEKTGRDNVSLFICGDILNKGKTDGVVCSPDMEKLVSSADYSVCNFEAPVSGFGKEEETPGGHHNQRPETIKGLRKQGFNMLLLANNHMLDFGKPALKATLKMAEEEGLDTIGAGLDKYSAYKPLIKTLKDLKIGLVNACEAQFGVLDYMTGSESAGYAWINHSEIDRNILSLKKECDFVIVFSHAGLEDFPLPQKEWRLRYKHLCDLGADIVIGSHPHVPQGYEHHGKSVIFYSLGNFYFDTPRYRNKDDSSFAVWLELKKGEKPSFKTVYHYKHNGFTDLAPENKIINLDKLNHYLGDVYETENDKMNMVVYNRIRNKLAISLFPPVPVDGRLKTFFRMIFSRILKKKISYRDLNQLILFRNDSLYYAIRHSLELRTQKGK